MRRDVIRDARRLFDDLAWRWPDLFDFVLLVGIALVVLVLLGGHFTFR